MVIFLTWRFHFYLKYKDKRAALDLLCKECHPPTPPPTTQCRYKTCQLSMILYRKEFFSSFTFTFQDLIKFNQFGNAVQCWIFVLYTHAPLSVPSTMHTVNSKCLHSIRSESFIQWNQTVPPVFFKFQQLYITHSVPSFPSLQLIWLNPSVT